MAPKISEKDSFLKLSRDTQISDIRKSYGFDNEKSISATVDAFEEWIKKQNHFVVKEFDRNYLEMYIINAKGSLEKAKQRLDKRMTLTELYSDMFENLNPEVEMKKLYSFLTHVHVPMCTKDYYRLIIDKPINGKEFNFVTYGRSKSIILEYGLTHDYCYGYDCIIDLLDCNLTELLTKLNPVVGQKIMIMLTEGFGTRMKSIHILCASKLVDMLVSLLKQCMSEKLGKRIQVHQSPDTLAKYFDKQCLPKEYGGTAGTMLELRDAFFKQLTSEEHKRHIKTMENYSTIESQRMAQSYGHDYAGVPGTFRSLSLD